MNLLISNNKESNIYYELNIFGNFYYKIYIQDEIIYLEKDTNTIIYKNNTNIREQKTIINPGDELNIFGLKIIILSNLIFIDSMNGKVTINENTSKIRRFLFPADEKIMDVKIKDIELYNQNDYFSKSPRIRRMIESKDIKLTAPPNNSENEELPLLLTIGPMLTMGVMSGSSLINTITRISSKETTIGDSWPQLLTGITMLASMLLWPTLTKKYNKKMKKKKREETIEKYNIYIYRK